MTAKKLMTEISNYLIKKYACTGITVAEQIDGVITSALSLAMNEPDKLKSFTFVITDTSKKFE